MTFFNYFRKLVKAKNRSAAVEYVREDHRCLDGRAHDVRGTAKIQPLAHDIDLSQQADLESYARDLSVSRESIERWISSGLLMPDEMKVAEKLIKLINKH